MLFQPQTCLSDLVIKILAVAACNIGKLHHQLNPAKFVSYQSTVWEVKLRISGENGQTLWRRGLNYNTCKQVIFFFFFRKYLADKRLPYYWTKKYFCRIVFYWKHVNQLYWQHICFYNLPSIGVLNPYSATTLIIPQVHTDSTSVLIIFKVHVYLFAGHSPLVLVHLLQLIRSLKQTFVFWNSEKLVKKQWETFWNNERDLCSETVRLRHILIIKLKDLNSEKMRDLHSETNWEICILKQSHHDLTLRILCSETVEDLHSETMKFVYWNSETETHS